MTVIIGAKCSDEIVLIADRKITDTTVDTLRYDNKIFGNIKNILIGYGGWIGTFDIYRNKLLFIFK
jgi:20S proteasome alpha/beta subunit